MADTLAARVAAAQARATQEHHLHRELRAARSWYETAGGAVAAGIVNRAAEAWQAAGCPETESVADSNIVTLAALVTDLWAEVDRLTAREWVGTESWLTDLEGVIAQREKAERERDEARAEVAALQNLLDRDSTDWREYRREPSVPTTGPTWGEHCAGLGEPTTTDKED